MVKIIIYRIGVMAARNLAMVKVRVQIPYSVFSAGMVKLADTQDLGSCAVRRGGSTPLTRIF